MGTRLCARDKIVVSHVEWKGTFDLVRGGRADERPAVSLVSSRLRTVDFRDFGKERRAQLASLRLELRLKFAHPG
jgi:hypothetical protein